MIIGDYEIGRSSAAWIIAEIGLNHLGSLDAAIQLIREAKRAGANAVKFQKRDPDESTPAALKASLRTTPWGEMTYLDYRRKVELSLEAYEAIADECNKLEITWFVSIWDLPSCQSMASYSACLKIPSARIGDLGLIKAATASGRPVILSTGMSDLEDVDRAVSLLDLNRTAILHCISTYPTQPSEVHLRCISTLRDRFDLPIGYSGHEQGILASIVAVAMGATIIERHFTLNREGWGSDQAVSLEPSEFAEMVRQIREVEVLLGDGSKRVRESERAAMERLKR